MARTRTLLAIVFAIMLLPILSAGGAEAALRSGHGHRHAAHHAHATKGHSVRHHHNHSSASTVASVAPQS